MFTAKDLQQRMADLGAYQGKIDGALGPLSIQAMMSLLDKLDVQPATVKQEPAKSQAAKRKFSRRVDEIVVHCTATPEGREFSRDAIVKMHQARGFTTIGYHWLVHLDGRAEPGRPEEQVGAHVAGHNANSIGV